VAIKEVAECIRREYTYGGYVQWKIENDKICRVPMPEDTPANASATKKQVWERHIGVYAKRDNHLMANLETAFSLVMGKCT
jgi:hypothetical protein